MQSARRKRSGNIGKVVDEGTVTLSKKSLGRNNHKYYRKVMSHFVPVPYQLKLKLFSLIQIIL